MSTEMRERLERRILDLAARLSADEGVVAGEDFHRWQRSIELNGREVVHRNLSTSLLPLSSLPLLAAAAASSGGASRNSSGRGRSTLLRNRLGSSRSRESVVTEPDKIHGRSLLKLQVVASDGGEYSSEYKVANLLEQTSATYCSAKSKNIVVVLEHMSTASFVVTHAVMRSPPRGSFTAPVKDALVFISNSPMNVGDFGQYDDYTLAQYDALLQRKAAMGESLHEGDPAAFLSTANAEDDGTVTTKLPVPRTGRFITVKFLRSVNSTHSTNIDCEFIGFKGFLGACGFADGTLR